MVSCQWRKSGSSVFVDSNRDGWLAQRQKPVSAAQEKKYGTRMQSRLAQSLWKSWGELFTGWRRRIADGR
jgi:hypothetical protein